MILKVTTRHALCALTYIVEKGMDDIVTAETIARERDIPISYLRRILSKMARHNLIKSFHGGSRMGYQMVRDPEDISLYEVMDLFEGWSGKACLLKPRQTTPKCNAHHYWEPIKDKMFSVFKKVSIALLCSGDIEANRETIRNL